MTLYPMGFAVVNDFIDFGKTAFSTNNAYAHVLMAPGYQSKVIWQNIGPYKKSTTNKQREDNKRIYSSFDNIISELLKDKNNVPQGFTVYMTSTYASVHHEMIESLRDIVKFEKSAKAPRSIDRYFIKAQNMAERYAKEAHQYMNIDINIVLSNLLIL